jgi:hypothetical protein
VVGLKNSIEPLMVFSAATSRYARAATGIALIIGGIVFTYSLANQTLSSNVEVHVHERLTDVKRPSESPWIIENEVVFIELPH